MELITTTHGNGVDMVKTYGIIFHLGWHTLGIEVDHGMKMI